MGSIRTGVFGNSEERDVRLHPLPESQDGEQGSEPTMNEQLFQNEKIATESVLPTNIQWFHQPDDSDLADMVKALKNNIHCLLITPVTLSSDSVKELISISHESNVKCYPVFPAFFSESLQEQLPHLSPPEFISLQRYYEFDASTSNEPLSDVWMNDVMLVLYLMKHEVKRCSASAIRSLSGQIKLIEIRLEFSHSKVANLLYAGALAPDSGSLDVFSGETAFRIPLLSSTFGHRIFTNNEMQSSEEKEAMQHHIGLCLEGRLKEELSIELLLQTTEVNRSILKCIEFMNEE